MTRLEVATLACKLLAIWTLTQAAHYAPALILILLALAGGGPVGSSRWQAFSEAMATAMPGIGLIAVGVILWWAAPQLAAHMVSSSDAPVTAPQLTSETVSTIALSMIGVALLVPAVRDLVRLVVRIGDSKYTFASFWSSPPWQAELWSTIVGLALSLWLIFGSRGIARFVLWARTAGRPTLSEADGQSVAS